LPISIFCEKPKNNKLTNLIILHLSDYLYARKALVRNGKKINAHLPATLRRVVTKMIRDEAINNLPEMTRLLFSSSLISIFKIK